MSSASAYEAHALKFLDARDGSFIGADVVSRWAKSLPAGTDVVEIACGGGYPVTRALVAAGINVWAIDASPTLLETFRSRFPGIPTQCSSALESDYFGRKFGAAIAIGLVFLLEEAEQVAFLQRVSEILLPGGRFLFTAPIQTATWRDLTTGHESRSLGDARYVQVLESAGFRVIGTHVDEGESHYYEVQKVGGARMTASNVDSSAHFNDAAAISTYADKTRRLVPGWADLQRMAALLVAERAPEQARVLVVGAGGGVELTAFAQMYSHWRFVGVDPSSSMLELAAAALGPLIERVELHHGYVDTAPAGPFDAATCLLTMHFIAADERRRTLREIRSRLQPGAPFVMAHMSIPQSAEEKKRWLARYVAFAISSGIQFENARNAAAAIEANLPLLSPDDEEAMLKEAGFSDTQLFYAGFAFRGWVTYA